MYSAAMKARIRLLRHRGARLPEPVDWREGMLETESSTVAGRTVRRLVLREFRAAPGMGIIAALYQPVVLEVDHSWWRLRGLEEVQLEDGRPAAVLQEWVVALV
jgi:hypothetical protein